MWSGHKSPSRTQVRFGLALLCYLTVPHQYNMYANMCECMLNPSAYNKYAQLYLGIIDSDAAQSC